MQWWLTDDLLSYCVNLGRRCNVNGKDSGVHHWHVLRGKQLQGVEGEPFVAQQAQSPIEGRHQEDGAALHGNLGLIAIRSEDGFVEHAHHCNRGKGSFEDFIFFWRTSKSEPITNIVKSWWILILPLIKENWHTLSSILFFSFFNRVF